MLDVIITQIKTGTIKNVVPFGYSRPPIPYVVVKPEEDPLRRGRMFRVFVHVGNTGQNQLEDYVFNELSTLIGDRVFTTRNGNQVKLYAQESFQDIITNNDDGSISMGRDFLAPFRLF